MPPVADTQLAEQYSVTVSLITSHREQVLKEGTHWHRDGKRVLWLASGLSATAGLVAGLDPEKKDGGAPGAASAAALYPPPPPDPPEPVAPPERCKAMARVSLKHPSPCWVKCHLSTDPDAGTFDVRISNANFLGPQAHIPVEQEPDGTSICTHPHHNPKPYRA